MTRQQYRQLQRKRPELKLPDWTTIKLGFRRDALSPMKVGEFVAWRTEDILVTEAGSSTCLESMSVLYPPF